MNKFQLITHVLGSTLEAQQKNILVDLIVKMDENYEAFPGIVRVAQVRNFKHAKNMNRLDDFLPGLVTVEKRGRKNFYILNGPAIEGLSQAEVVYKGTVYGPSGEGPFKVEYVSDNTNGPSSAGHNGPSPADEGPSVAENGPAGEGAYSTSNNTKDSTEDSRAESGSKEDTDVPASAGAQAQPSLTVENFNLEEEIRKNAPDDWTARHVSGAIARAKRELLDDPRQDKVALVSLVLDVDPEEWYW